MIDNSQDKGYITVYLKQVGNVWHLCEMSFTQNIEEKPFYVDYEKGTIFVITGDEKSIIGTYETTFTSQYGAKVFDYPSNRVIGRVGKELIYFRRKDEEFAAGRYSPEEECLAYYTENGSITAKSVFPYWGIIDGSEIGGAAAFVALFYNYRFQSIFRDYFTMDDASFRKKHALSTDAENYKGSSEVYNQHSGWIRSYVTEGPIDLKDALNNLKDIPNPNLTVQSQIVQYERILNSAGTYEQVESEYGPHYLTLSFYVLDETVYAKIDYSGFAGYFNRHGVVTCAGKENPVIIESVGVNKYTGGEHLFTFTINAGVVNITGNNGFGQKTCRRASEIAK